MRYARNIGPLTPEEQQTLLTKRVCIIGCGGIGGYTAEYLARLGIGHITAVDPDVFDPTNLNRQLCCTEETLGQSKAEAVRTRIAVIDPKVSVTAETVPFCQDNAVQLLSGHDLIIDALDNIPTRMVLQRFCRELEIPLIHSAVDSWFIQVSTILPGEDTLSRIYPGASEDPTTAPAEKVPALSFVPGFAAALQASEAVKLLTRKGALLRSKILFADLLNNQFDILPL